MNAVEKGKSYMKKKIFALAAVFLSFICWLETGISVLASENQMPSFTDEKSDTELIAEGYDMDQYYEDVQMLYQFLMEGTWPSFIKDNVYIDYCKVVDSFSGMKVIMEGASWLLEENLTTDRYLEILNGLIITMSGSISDSMEKQKEIDTLKTVFDYAMDVTDIVAGSVKLKTKDIVIYNQKIMEKIDNLEMMMDLTLDTIDMTLSNLEDIQACDLLVNNYYMYGEFLSAIEENADDTNLIRAAGLMKKNLGLLFEYQLEKGMNMVGNFAEVLGKDVVFEPVISMFLEDVDLTGYSKSQIRQFESLKKITDLAEKGEGISDLFGPVFKLGIFTGDMLFGTTNTYNRYNEMVALTKIRTALNNALEKHNQKCENEISFSEIEKGCNLLRNIIYVDFRGYYCLFNMIENDSQMLSAANFNYYKTYESWFEDATAACTNYIDIIDSVFPDLANYKEESEDTFKSTVKNLIQKSKDLGLSGKLASYESKYKNYTLYYPAEWIDRLSFTETETGLAINTKDGLTIAEEENYGSGFWRHTCYLLAKVFYDYTDAAECYAATEDPNSLIHTEDLFWKKGAGVESFQNLPVSDDMNYVLYLEKNDSMPDGWHEVSSNTESTLERAEATREVIRKIEVLKYGFIENQNIAGE